MSLFDSGDGVETALLHGRTIALIGELPPGTRYRLSIGEDSPEYRSGEYRDPPGSAGWPCFVIAWPKEAHE